MLRCQPGDNSYNDCDHHECSTTCRTLDSDMSMPRDQDASRTGLTALLRRITAIGPPEPTERARRPGRRNGPTRHARRCRLRARWLTQINDNRPPFSYKVHIDRVRCRTRRPERRARFRDVAFMAAAADSETNCRRSSGTGRLDADSSTARRVLRSDAARPRLRRRLAVERARGLRHARQPEPSTRHSRALDPTARSAPPAFAAPIDRRRATTAAARRPAGAGIPRRRPV